MINLTSPKEIARLLSVNHLSPLKKFGQNFLCDENVVNKIADSIGLTKNDYVLEVGTGLGTLTRALSMRAKKVVSVEIDIGLLALHPQTLEGCVNVQIIKGDILTCDLVQICQEYFEGESFYVCGNLPYYITSKILMQLLESAAPILSITAMVQKEVAQRLAAQPGDTDYSSFAASCLYYAQPQILFEVSHRCFYPMPDVDSSIIRFVLGTPLCDAPRDQYVKIVRAAFCMRRKTLFNNFKQLADSDTVITILENCNIDPKMRAQNLFPAQFCSLAKAFFQNKTKNL